MAAFQVGLAPKPVQAHLAIDSFCNKFAACLAKDDALRNLFVQNGSWADPVGKPPYVGKDVLAERITKLPPMESIKVAEVFYTADDKIFLCKVEVHIKGASKPFVVLDKFAVESEAK